MSSESKELTEETITFGKYKNKTLSFILKDRNYCKWLLDQDWFKSNYEFLYNRVKTYNPSMYFLKTIEKTSTNDFIDTYKYFSLVPITDIIISLTADEKKCYLFYIEMIDMLKSKISCRVDEENPYAIKAPVNWLKTFEKKYELSRSVFKDFISSYDLPNITSIVEDIKKHGGIDYKGARSFIIAKENSLKQEKWWEGVLKERYGEDIGTQFKYDSCIFDFLNISTNTIFECKLSLKDFNDEQHKKYKLTLGKYRIVYLIDTDCVVWIENKTLYTTNYDKYDDYIFELQFSKKQISYLDELIRDFKLVKIDDLSSLFGKNDLADEK